MSVTVVSCGKCVLLDFVVVLLLRSTLSLLYFARLRGLLLAVVLSSVLSRLELSPFRFDVVIVDTAASVKSAATVAASVLAGSVVVVVVVVALLFVRDVLDLLAAVRLLIIS